MSNHITDRIAKLKEKQDQLATRLAALQSKAKTSERKRDTRRKIIVGAAVIAAMENDTALSESIRRILAASVTRQQDKDVLGGLLTGVKEKSSALSSVELENADPSAA